MKDNNKHRESKAQAMYAEAMGGKRRANVMLADGGSVRKQQAAAIKNPIMRAGGGSVQAMKNRAVANPIMRKKGGTVLAEVPRSELREERAEGSKMKIMKPTKLAMGGVGKQRKSEMSKSGAPMKAPRKYHGSGGIGGM